MIAAHAALLAWKAGPAGQARLRPRRGHGGHHQAPPLAHPASARRSTADGHLLALDIDFVIDGGAYATLSPVVLSRGTIHAAGPYRCPNVRVTQPWPSPPTRRRTARSAASARRRASSPSSATSIAWRRRSASLPAELRRRNFVRQRRHHRRRPGHPRGRRPRRPARPRLRGHRLPREARALRRARTPARRREQGDRLRLLLPRRRLHRLGRGAPRLGGRTSRRPPTATCACSRRAPRSARAPTPILAQIAADALGRRLRARSRSPQPDTARGPQQRPDGGLAHLHGGGQARGAGRPRLASRSCAPPACWRARTRPPTFARRLRARYIERIGPLAAQSPLPTAARACAGTTSATRAMPTAPTRGRSTSPRCTVDTATGEAHGRRLRRRAGGGAGHPPGARRRADRGRGGAGRSAGRSTRTWCGDDGRMANAQMTNYIIPTAADMPPIRVEFVEAPYAHGPGGRQGDRRAADGRPRAGDRQRHRATPPGCGCGRCR